MKKEDIKDFLEEESQDKVKINIMLK